MTVSGRHYANNVPDELFARVAGLGDGAESSAHPNAHMKLHETAGKGQKQKRASGKAGSPKSSVGVTLPPETSPCRMLVNSAWTHSGKGKDHGQETAGR